VKLQIGGGLNLSEALVTVLTTCSNSKGLWHFAHTVHLHVLCNLAYKWWLCLCAAFSWRRILYCAVETQILNTCCTKSALRRVKWRNDLFRTAVLAHVYCVWRLSPVIFYSIPIVPQLVGEIGWYETTNQGPMKTNSWFIYKWFWVVKIFCWKIHFNRAKLCLIVMKIYTCFNITKIISNINFLLIILGTYNLNYMIWHRFSLRFFNIFPLLTMISQLLHTRYCQMALNRQHIIISSFFKLDLYL
jgi:hypothetical protein